eukprot:4958329-Prorocentrum_lima.AAC.1
MVPSLGPLFPEILFLSSISRWLRPCGAFAPPGLLWLTLTFPTVRYSVRLASLPWSLSLLVVG